MLAVGQTGPSAWGSFTGRGGQEAAGLAAVQGGANEVAADEYVCCQKPKCLKIKKKSVTVERTSKIGLNLLYRESVIKM